jgi:hypothetical protein
MINGNDQKHISELLNSKRCGLWPQCSCFHHLTHWQEKLSDEKLTWTVQQLAEGETAIFYSLSCAAMHCPDRKVRTFCQMQLLNPFWDHQRRGEEMTKELFAQRQAQQ